jgi:RecA-family ATPase
MSAKSPANDDFLEAVPVSKLTPKSVSWLWHNRLPLGKLAILDGDPNLGKSLVTLDLCARITTGRHFPDGAASPCPANVLVINGEDGNQDTIWPRLLALGADLDRVFIVHRKEHQCGLLRLPSQVAALERLIKQSAAKPGTGTF